MRFPSLFLSSSLVTTTTTTTAAAGMRTIRSPSSSSSRRTAAYDEVDDALVFLGPSHDDLDDRIVVPVDARRPPASASSVAMASTIALLLAATVPSAAHAAAGPDWGIFEGRTGSLLHPIAMLSMFALSTSTAYLGYQWRRQRTLGDEISTLKKSLPGLVGGADAVSSALKDAMEADAIDREYVDSLKMALETEGRVAELTKERKELASSNPRDKHFNQGALLLFVGTAFAIEGPLNTYARAGKLFPGPHLYAGAGLVVLWSLAAGMVPHMQKGNDLARTVHIGANVAGMALFAWQVSTGLPILFKVIELTKWP